MKDGRDSFLQQVTSQSPGGLPVMAAGQLFGSWILNHTIEIALEEGPNLPHGFKK